MMATVSDPWRRVRNRVYLDPVRHSRPSAGTVENHADHELPDASRRVLLVTSQGGHLTQLMRLRAWWERYDRVWVGPATPDVVDRLAGEKLVGAHHPTTRNVPNAVRNLLLAWRALRAEQPDLVVSAGAGVAVPFFVLARLMGVPTVFIEVYDRVDTPTMTGRLCGPFTTKRIVQWESQLRFYPDATLVGPLL